MDHNNRPKADRETDRPFLFGGSWLYWLLEQKVGNFSRPFRAFMNLVLDSIVTGIRHAVTTVSVPQCIGNSRREGGADFTRALMSASPAGFRSSPRAASRTVKTAWNLMIHRFYSRVAIDRRKKQSRFIVAQCCYPLLNVSHILWRKNNSCNTAI